MGYFVATDKLSTAYFAGAVEVTEEEYSLLLDGVINHRKQVYLVGTNVSLRTPPPNGTGEGYSYKPLIDKWQKNPPVDYDGENYFYYESNNTWYPVEKTEEPATA